MVVEIKSLKIKRFKQVIENKNTRMDQNMLNDSKHASEELDEELLL